MKALLVTFPNDLGSRTIEANLIKFVSAFADLRIFRFAAQDSDQIDKRLDNMKNLLRRVQDAARLRSAVRSAVREGRKILFYNISPATFAYGSWAGGEAYITMDWARRLLADKTKADRDPMTHVHKRVLHACKRILPMTDAMADCLARDYQVPQDRIRRVPSLFDVNHFDPGEITHTGTVRVLFMGGDVVRKGGDLLYSAFKTHLRGKCSLTMVTNAEFDPVEGMNLVKGVRYGTDEHLSLMRNHDVFIMPTREDAGPQVIGEAAAAGLAVFTTKAALGAPHVVRDGISGVIASSPEACIEKLETALESHPSILAMRRQSLEWMRSEFSSARISEAYCSALA